MATNILSKSRAKYITPKELAEQYSLSKAQVYKLLANPIFKEAVHRPSEKLIRINQDLIYDLMNKYFNS